MAIGTGQVSLGDIADEYGGSAPHALSEYYDKGNAPGSGEIQIHADFNGTANVFNFTLSSNASQVNLRSAAVSAGWDQSSPVHATINSGVIIHSGSTGSYAMVINGSWSGGVTLTNNGTILGRGGNGAKGSYTTGCGTQGCYCSDSNTGNSPLARGTAGSGGPALQITTETTIYNGSGRISGGGGGGGGGSAFHTFAAPGGGGGGGIGGSSAGGTHGGSGGGSGGTLTAAGSGGSGYAGPACGGNTSGAGGAGGGYGSAGANGGNGSSMNSTQYNGTNGGAAGAATSGQSNVTWASTGTRNGSLG